MTVYYHLTFLLLASEMVTFCLLVAPLPSSFRKTIFGFLRASPIVAKIVYVLKISFIFVAILFIDALQRMFKITAELQQAKSAHQAPDARVEANIAARKFYAQRNVYLTGFCLFLSLVLARTFAIMIDLVETKEKYKKLEKQTSTNEEVKTLKEQLAAKDRDLETLKKQAKQLGDEYNRLGDKYNKATGSVSDKRKD
ncbi:hypothetical protein AX16_003417 [Volvariella volvacea WC 439]|nr:hypothetical protein AX16_003417 [Volvariella volvacea WC 439]